MVATTSNPECPRCGSEDVETVGYDRNEFEALDCRECGLEFGRDLRP